VVVSSSLAEEHFQGENPVGRRIRFGRDDDDPWLEIVGVVGDVQHYTLGRTSMCQVYVPITQRLSNDVSFVIATAVDPRGLMDGIRAEVAAIDPDQPLADFQPLETMVSSTISVPRFRTLLVPARRAVRVDLVHTLTEG